MTGSEATGFTRPGRRQASGNRVMPCGYHRLLDWGVVQRSITGRADYQHSRRVVTAMGSSLLPNKGISNAA